MSERSLRAIDFFSVLLLFIQVSESLKMTSRREHLTIGYDAVEHPVIHRLWNQLNHHDAVPSLQKVLRSVEDDEQEDLKVKDIKSALTSIERETEYHENRKRTKIARVLASVEEHTNQALAQNSSSTEEGDERNSDEAEISLPDTGIRNREGRTIHLKTNNGNKRVFIPRGWMFCTIQPPKCFSKKKRDIK
ncbi:uncharacterized protein LOC114974116 [Acropora millepora]|uniref:uncharacterized protein LOC114974116 n=1 Tax=Acropora millepora TaxID=45264 RepID=UPI001CF5794D|nr:uncharacterized protein LOC114974116 [Acropora millepora]